MNENPARNNTKQLCNFNDKFCFFLFHLSSITAEFLPNNIIKYFLNESVHENNSAAEKNINTLLKSAKIGVEE